MALFSTQGSVFTYTNETESTITFIVYKRTNFGFVQTHSAEVEENQSFSFSLEESFNYRFEIGESTYYLYYSPTQLSVVARQIRSALCDCECKPAPCNEEACSCEEILFTFYQIFSAFMTGKTQHDASFDFLYLYYFDKFQTDFKCNTSKYLLKADFRSKEQIKNLLAILYLSIYIAQVNIIDTSYLHPTQIKDCIRKLGFFNVENIEEIYNEIQGS